MRSLALAEELRSRGLEPVFFSDSDSVPWLGDQVVGRGFVAESPPAGDDEHAKCFQAGFAAVVFDSYLLPSDTYRAVRATGLPTMAIVDGELRGAEADLFLDQNAGAEGGDVALPDGSQMLAGLGYALIRDDVLALRPGRPRHARRVRTPEVLAVFGGTDAFGAAPVAVTALAMSGCPFRATVVAPDDALRTKIEQVRLTTDQQVHVVGPSDRLAQLVLESDMVVSAAGSSTLEQLTLGACSALICVADNQEPGYRSLVRSGAVTGLGRLAEVSDAPDGAADRLARLLRNHELRQELSSVAWNAVDGHGRVRVADALLALVGRAQR